MINSDKTSFKKIKIVKELLKNIGLLQYVDHFKQQLLPPKSEVGSL
jgi:hypothetical protein